MGAPFPKIGQRWTYHSTSGRNPGEPRHYTVESIRGDEMAGKGLVLTLRRDTGTAAMVYVDWLTRPEHDRYLIAYWTCEAA